MSANAAELLKRAFAGFQPIAKRDPRTPGAVEVDLGKVAEEIAKAAALGAEGDVDGFEKALDDVGVLLEKAVCEPQTDKIFAPVSEVAKRVAVSKEDGRYYVDHGSGAAKPPAKGSKEQKDNEYTAEGGLANEKGEQYTETSNASVATTPSGAPAIGFDQPAGGPAAKAATSKAQTPPPAKPTRTNEGAAAAEGETASEPAVSEGISRRRGKTAKAATRHVTTEELWANDMAALGPEDVAEIRKAAKAQAAGAGPEAEVDQVDNEKAKKAAAKKARTPSGGAEASVNEDAEGPMDKAPSESVDDRSSADAKRKAAKIAAAKAKKNAEGGRQVGAEDVDTVKAKDSEDDEEYDGEDAEDDDEDEESDEKPFPPKKGKGKVEKSADDEPVALDAEVEWESDLSPAQSPVGKAARTPVGELGAKAGDARSVEKRHREIRSEALSIERLSGDVLSPDQVAELRKSARMTPGQRRRANAKRLREKGYEPGSREISVDGIDEAAVVSEE